MKFSYNWIAELVDGLDVDARELSRLITMKTAECEGVEVYGAWLDKVRAAMVLSAEPIADSKNVRAAVDAGERSSITVVCGAPNCRAGVVTAYVPAGTHLAEREIRKVVIQGVESDGMLASAAELGINRDHSGILELGLEPGERLGLEPDPIIEIDNKSLTHRPDLWGHYGMAREVAAIVRRKLEDPVHMDRLPTGPASIHVRIENYDLCPRYSALVFENVKVKPSPLWLQYRLQAIGLNPINNIVDVTNYIMAELAQPTHAFDADKLNGAITVRSAGEGETLAALNGETYVLNPSNLVIADQGGAIALAGVIGGMSSAISETTSRIVLESACFNASSVRKTSSGLKLRTDASMRFEKAQDPENTVRALARAIDLLNEVCPGIGLLGGVADTRQPLAPTPEIELDLDWLNRKLGRTLDQREVVSILESLEFTVAESAHGVLTVVVPTWRATKDISIREDLVEEIGRMVGYGSITPQAPLVPAKPPLRNEKREYLYDLRNLVAARGFTEVYNYSFLSEETARQFSMGPEAHLAVANPIAADQSLMRTSLIPGIWKNIVENSKYANEFRIFEIGREIHGTGNGLPREVTHLAAAVYHNDGDAAGLFELKKLAECVVPGIDVRPTQPRPFEHPARIGELTFKESVVGRLFEFHPDSVRGRGSVLDIDLDALFGVQPDERQYRPIRRFPSSAFDLSVVAPERALVGDIQKELAQLAGEGLEDIIFVRQYSGPPLPAGTKSVSFRLTVAAANRTLSSEEVGACRAAIIDGMRGRGYELRV